MTRMRKHWSIIATTALIAFLVGFFSRGYLDRLTHDANRSNPAISQEMAEPPSVQDSTNEAAKPLEAQVVSDVPLVSDNDHLDIAAVDSTVRSLPQELDNQYIRRRLSDFFSINGIDPDRAEEMVQGLAHANQVVARKGNAMLDRHAAEKADLILEGNIVRITHTPGEKAELAAEREALDRQVFGEFYETYKIYRQSNPQRRVVNTFSESMQEPLQHGTRESITQIMYEEHLASQERSEQVSEGFGGHSVVTDRDSLSELETYRKRLSERRSYYEKVIRRVAPYLNSSQLDQFSYFLEKDAQRFELLIKLQELEN